MKPNLVGKSYYVTFTLAIPVDLLVDYYQITTRASILSVTFQLKPANRQIQYTMSIVYT